jgi:chromosome segregation ATPase
MVEILDQGYYFGQHDMKRKADRAVAQWEAACNQLKRQLNDALERNKRLSTNLEKHQDAIRQWEEHTANLERQIEERDLKAERLQRRVTYLEENERGILKDYHTAKASTLGQKAQKNILLEEAKTCPANIEGEGSHHRSLQGDVLESAFDTAAGEYAEAQGYVYDGQRLIPKS